MIPTPDPNLPATVTAPPADAPATLSRPAPPASNAATATPAGLRSPDPDGLPPAFVIERELGRGGMGVVYLARQSGLNRSVALKKMFGASSQAAVIRFLAEAEAVAAIRHPNVVEVYQYGDDGGQPFLALEYCDGGDLTAKTKAGKTAPREAAELMAAIADGVGAAHAAGIVHRDLKPDNVLLAGGVPKVTDFGLAKRGPGADLTGSHVVMGTPAYMSPEQAGGKTKFVGPESDASALGVMLYELLAGARPFAGPSNADFFAQILSGNFDSLRKACPDVPRDLDLIVRKCLRQDPRERYANAGELAADLRNWLAGKSISARPMGSLEAAWKWGRRNPAVASSLAVALVAMVLGTAISLWQRNEARYQERQAEAKAEELATALGEKTVAEGEAKAKAEALNRETVKLNEQLKESRRLHDLSRLREAEADFDRNAVQAALDKLDEIAPENRCIAWGLLRKRLDGADLILLGHTAVVTGAVFSPDGTRIATASHDRTVRIWDAVTGQFVLELTGHKARVTSVCFSPDGTRIVTGSWDETARIWDATTGQSVRELKGHTNSVMGVAFSPDGTRIATGSDDTTARVWDAATGRCVSELKGHTNSVMGVAFSPDGRQILTGAGDETARVWEVATGQGGVVLKGHTRGLTSVGFSPDGRRIATGSYDKTARVWDATTGRCVSELIGHTDPVSSLAFGSDGARIATGSYDKTARVWDASTGRSVSELKGHTNDVVCVCFSPDGRRIVTGSLDQTARVWDTVTGQRVLALKGHSDRVTSVAFSPDGRRIVTGSLDQTARVWDAATGHGAVVLRGHTRGLTSVCFSPDGTRIATGSWDETARIWDATTGQSVRELKGHTDRVTGVAFRPDGRQVLTGSDDTTARVWDAATGRCVSELKGHSAWVTGVAFRPDGRQVITGSWDETARVWDAATGGNVLRLKHSAWVTSVAFSPDGRQILTGAGDETARVWDAATGRIARELKGHSTVVASVGFNPDGARIVTGAWGKTARVWETITGLGVLELKGHTDRITGAGFSSDGTRIVTGSDDRTARVWDASFSPIPKGVPKIPPPAEAELARRRWIARPDPERHADLAEQHKADPFARATQLALEQRARGQLAVEALDFPAARKHFLAATLLKPKTYQFPEVAPPPRPAK